MTEMESTANSISSSDPRPKDHSSLATNGDLSNGCPADPVLSNGHANGVAAGSESPVGAVDETSVFNQGFELEDLYKHALRFYKDYELKAFAPTYQDRNKLAALSLQSKHGPMAGVKKPQLGALDFVGRDRKQCWQLLGPMPRQQSMQQFIQLLSDVCPLFLPFVQAHANERQERRLREEQECLKEERDQEQEEREQEGQRLTSQKKAVQEVLNQQTQSQFLAYAEQQYPAESDKQQHLIKQLQEQHYQQYMQQMLQLQSQSVASSVPPVASSEGSTDRPADSPLLPNKETNVHGYQSMRNTDGDHVHLSSGMQDEEYEVSAGVMEPAKMWTRQDIDAFKESIRKEGTEGMIRVNHGEIVTIKVPTHADGLRIFWEFCTDTYDIGFGVFFEWSESPGNQVSVHVSDSEEEDEDEDDVSASGRDPDPENVVAAADVSQEVIIPVFRRDSHEDVFVGSHTYPGRGVYHLKFDNTYSLWRSKTLFYRVYYTR